MNYRNREALRLKNIRDTKRKVNKAVKRLVKLGINALHCKKVFDSRQCMFSYAEGYFGKDLTDNYLLINKITEGKHSTPDTLYILWAGDVTLMCDILADEGLTVEVPVDDKKTIVVKIDLYGEEDARR